MPAAVETMFSGNRKTPWHGLGEVVEGNLNAHDALVVSGLDWEVHPKPIYLAESDEPIQNRVANVRDVDGSVLGIVSDRYTILQNEDAFRFADGIVDDGAAHYETAGSLRDGRRVWMMLKLSDEIKIAGEDVVETYLCLTNSHDGSSGITAMVTPVRVVCQNTLNFALSKAERTWTVRHVGSLDGKLDEARRALELTFEYRDEFTAKAEALITQKVSDSQFESIVSELTDVEKHAEGILTTFRTSPNLENVRNTAWGAVNAVGEYADWGRDVQSEEARFRSATTGKGRQLRDRTLELLAARA